MNIEIKNFYVFERNDQKQLIKGTLHVTVKLVDDIELNIRGVLATKERGRWFIRMPFKNGIDPLTKTSVTYPILTLSDQNLSKALIDGIYKKAPAFIEEFLKTNPQPLEAQNHVIQTKSHFSQQNSQEELLKNEKPHETNASKPSPQAASKSKIWSDPPPRKAIFCKNELKTLKCK